MPSNTTASMLLTGLQFHFPCRGLLFEHSPWLESRSDASKLVFVRSAAEDVQPSEFSDNASIHSLSNSAEIAPIRCQYRGDLHVNLQVDWSLATIEDLRTLLHLQVGYYAVYDFYIV
jgi:hypothetical protein